MANCFKYEGVGMTQFWYENGVKQGTKNDPKNILDKDGNPRGREIYDPETDAWYWLDAEFGGAVAKNKEVWIPYVHQGEKPGSTNGKWVRYDKDGHMVKGWCEIHMEIENPTWRHMEDLEFMFYDLATGAASDTAKNWGLVKPGKTPAWNRPASGRITLQAADNAAFTSIALFDKAHPVVNVFLDKNGNCIRTV